MWTVVLIVVLTLIVAGVLLWAVWPTRTGAVAAGERGNDGIIPSVGDSDGGGPGPGIGE